MQQHYRLIERNRLEPDYSQFGINFPAPSPSDYDHEDDTKFDGLIPINANSITTEIAIPTESSSVTLFPVSEEKETGNAGEEREENRNSISAIDVNVTEQPTDHSRSKENPEVEESNDCIHEEKQRDRKLKLVEEKIPKLQRFITLLHESNITKNDLIELTQLLETKKVLKFKSTDSRIFFTSPAATPTTAPTFQHIKEINKSFITSPPIALPRSKLVDVTENEDNDLLSSTTPRPKAKAVRIEPRSRNRPKINSIFTPLRRPTLFPRRIAYRARLPVLTDRTPPDITKPKQFEVSTRNRVIPRIRLAEQKLDGQTQAFMQHAAQNSFKQSEILPTMPIFGIHQAATLPPSTDPQATNVLQLQPNNAFWPYQRRADILRHPNLHSNSNFG
ncbi:unnamed protein product [Litomosoides sigmodontis]|uniref:Uncharacterized protein n=1 Tax=Litomosoides sigmodontis TaxID=42156 RepID=A0A3P6TWQ2_LITSI|nr:unnamed protein product [Litomosoides sigmodontis]